ncbi:MAG: uridine kinase [Bacteriovoracaceae bacterium]
MKSHKQPYIVGIAGGSGSGKTTFASRLKERFENQYPHLTCKILLQDNYYIDQSHKFDHDGGSVNFDHPESLDFDLMATHLKQIKRGQSIEIPQYDFKTHTRQKETNHLSAPDVLLIDGILILHPENVSNEFDHSIFVEAPEDLRYSRRLKRDVEERGRTPEGVQEQFQKQVKPMHDHFVEPTKLKSNLRVTVESFDDDLEITFKYLLEKLS